MSYSDNIRVSKQSHIIPQNDDQLVQLDRYHKDVYQQSSILVWFSKGWLVGAIILFAILTRIPLMLSPLTYSSTDVWRQTDTATIARNFYENNHNIFYPQINWGGSGPGYVETEFQLYTFITAGFYGVLGEHEWIGRMVSLIFMTGALIFFYLLVNRLFKQRIAIAALILMMLSPLSIRYSTAFMPEATVFFFYIAALYLFVVWLDNQHIHTLILAAISTALAILVKPTALHIGLIFLILLIKRHRFEWIKKPELWVFGAISLLPAVAYYLHARNLYLTYGNTFGLFSGGDSKFGNFDYWLSPTFYWNVLRLDLQWIFGWAGAILFGVGLFSARRQRQAFFVTIGLITIAFYYLIVARYAQEEWGVQYHIFMLPYAALGMGVGIIWILDQIQHHIRQYTKSIMTVVSLATVAILSVGFVPSFQELSLPTSQELEDCGVHVRETVPEDDLILASTYAPLYAEGSDTMNNYQEPNIFYYSHRKGWSLPWEWNTPEKLDSYRQQGASYFVIHHEQLLLDNPDLQTYLSANGRQVGPGANEGCAIYQFDVLASS
jgi:hypothetical protein